MSIDPERNYVTSNNSTSRNFTHERCFLLKHLNSALLHDVLWVSYKNIRSPCFMARRCQPLNKNLLKSQPSAIGEAIASVIPYSLR